MDGLDWQGHLYLTHCSKRTQNKLGIVQWKGVMKRAVKWTSTDVDIATNVDERRPSTGWKSAVWSTSTKKSAVASTSTVDGQRL